MTRRFHYRLPSFAPVDRENGVALMSTIPRGRLRSSGLVLLTLVFLVALPAVAHAAQADPDPAGMTEETRFVLNTFALLVWGALVMWMCAGFTMLESGSVRTKNASMICLKNVGIYSSPRWRTCSSATTSCTWT